MFPRIPELNGNGKEYVDMQRERYANAIEGCAVLGQHIAYLADFYRSRRVLDLASGATPLPVMLRRCLGSHVELVVADINPELLDLARELHSEPGIKYERFDLENPHDIGKYDFVYFAYALHHLNDVRKALGNASLLVEDPGALFLRDLSRHVPEWLREEDITRYIEERKRMLADGEKHAMPKSPSLELTENQLLSTDSILAAYTPEEVRPALISAGFESDRIKCRLSAGGRVFTFLAVKDSENTVYLDDNLRAFRKKGRLFVPE